MRNWKQTLMGLVSVVAVLSLAPALAAQDSYESGGHMCGGVGIDGRQAMRAERKEYNVHLAFAQARTGEFLAGLKVHIEHLGDKREMGPYEDCGPLLYVQLPPGQLPRERRIRRQAGGAEHHGEPQAQRPCAVLALSSAGSGWRWAGPSGGPWRLLFQK